MGATRRLIANNRSYTLSAATVVVRIVPDAVIRLQSHANGTRDRACYKCPATGRVGYTMPVLRARPPEHRGDNPVPFALARTSGTELCSVRTLRIRSKIALTRIFHRF